MNLIRCENGHFYDADRFDYCPHCNQSTVSTVGLNTEGDKMYTQPLDTTERDEDNSGKTIGYFDSWDVKVEPAVGWVVAVEGEHVGESFVLKTGRNFIGRNSDMDVALTKDGTVSRVKHATIVYEPVSNIFIVHPGEARELFYLIGKVVLQATQIEPYDMISLGKTKLIFIPFCSERFTWVNPNEENK